MTIAFTLLSLAALLYVVAHLTDLFGLLSAGCAGFDMRDWKKRLRNEAAVDKQWNFQALENDPAKKAE